MTAPASPDVPQLTLRAALTGMALGGVLALCNIYTGLKLGWSSSMSVTAALLGFALWRALERGGAARFGILENNMNQTAASSSAFASSAGLVAPIPALAMITGRSMTWPLLSLWVLSVMLVGVLVAVSMRRTMIERDKLPFPFGIATAETLKEMHAKGREAMSRVTALLLGGAVAGGLKLAKELFKLPRPTLPLSIGGATFNNLGLSLDPALLMVGVGALMGFRMAASTAFGAVIAWGVVGPYALDMGFTTGKANPDVLWFGSMIKWLLWPGVALMVSSALTSFLLGVPAMVRKWLSSDGEVGEEKHGVPARWFFAGLALAIVLSGLCQILLFDIVWWMALLGVLIAFVLAIVAGRVSGETGITPVGPMGKVTQLIFGVIKPDDAIANLMTANVTGGAASQCGDMLHDLKTGHMLGAWPNRQALAQAAGALSGALAGSAGYLLLVPDVNMLLTDEWPAPAAAQWKAVAELFAEGFDKMPAGSPMAIAVAGGVGIALALLHKALGKKAGKWVPSASAMGLAFVVPAYFSFSIIIGGIAALLANKYFESWSKRFLVVVASGLIVGESLTGVGFAIKAVLSG